MTSFIIAVIFSVLFVCSYYIADGVNKKINEEALSEKLIRALGWPNDTDMDTFVIYVILTLAPLFTIVLWPVWLIMGFSYLAWVGLRIALNFIVDIITLAIEEKNNAS